MEVDGRRRDGVGKFRFGASSILFISKLTYRYSHDALEYVDKISSP